VQHGLLKAMELFERAEALRPPTHDDPILRWNSCARTLKRLGLTHPSAPSESSLE
jgi:hypothetical protein